MSTTAVAGPLTANDELGEHLLFRHTSDAARWLAYVGLGGRYVAVRYSSRWLRWNGASWADCDGADVNRAVRRALGAVYDRRMAESPTTAEVMQLLRLMDLNWTLGPLVYELRRITSETVRA